MKYSKKFIFFIFLFIGLALYAGCGGNGGGYVLTGITGSDKISLSEPTFQSDSEEEKYYAELEKTLNDKLNVKVKNNSLSAAGQNSLPCFLKNIFKGRVSAL